MARGPGAEVETAATAEAASARADAALAGFDVDAGVAHLSAAIRGFTAAGDRCRAAMACARLGDVYATAMGNLTAGRAWFARARRLVADEPDCVEQGWVAVAAMGCDVDDPAELLAAAELALARARAFGDVDLETKAMADAGLAHVQSGRIAEGMALLDEAMALACGPTGAVDVAAKSVCSFFTACYHAGDFGRAATWADALRRRGLIDATSAPTVFLSSHCDALQATVLVELGRWGEAETVLQRARAEFEAFMGVPSWHPDIALADLRVRQGRLADAEALLLGRDQSIEALLPAARLHLARGDHALATATARRGLRAVADDRLRAVELLTVLVDAALGAGDVAAAAGWSDDLAARTAAVAVPALVARAASARARVLEATGDVAAALAVVEAAVDVVDVRQLPWRRATLLVQLAGLRAAAGDLAAARLDARSARAARLGLDLAPDPVAAALLDHLDPPTVAAPTATATATASLCPDGRWWTAVAGGASVRLADSKGLRHLAELVAHPGVERHALDLVDRVDGVGLRDAAARRSLGDAGPLADGRARAAYRHRIEALRAEADDALARGALERAEAAQSELDQLVAHLAAAFGLGGRERRAGSAAERARLNVTRAIRSATARLSEALPDAGPVLDRRVRTGLYSAYEPAAGDPVRWIVHLTVNDPTRH